MRTVSPSDPRPATPLAFVSVPGVSSLHDDRTRVLGEQVVVEGDGELVCIDLPSRTELWRKPALGDASEPPRVPPREWRLGDELVAVQLTDQQLALREATGRGLWTARFRPYIHDVTRMPHGAVLVATAGRGGYVHVVNAATGVIESRTKVPGGAWGFVHAASPTGSPTAHVLASGWKAFARIAPTGNVTVWKVRDAFRVLWARGDEVALLTNPPRAGVAFVSCIQPP